MTDECVTLMLWYEEAAGRADAVAGGRREKEEKEEEEKEGGGGNNTSPPLFILRGASFPWSPEPSMTLTFIFLPINSPNLLLER